MKKILITVLLLSISIFFISCEKEDEIITQKFLEDSYNENYLNLSSKNLTVVPNFEKYLTGSYIYDIWTIDLSNNNIKNIKSDYFEYFPNLKEINLSYNKVEKIKLNHNFIKNLKLHKNKLEQVDLSGVNLLNTLNLGYNELLSLDDTSFPKNIKILELQHNKLSDLNGIGELKGLERLKLEFNKLEDSDLSSLKGLDKLSFISVKYNKLSKDLEKSFDEFNTKMK